MKLVVQRVVQASVQIDNQITASIGQGLLVYVGLHHQDQLADCDYWCQRLLKLRIFADDQKPINRSVVDIDGEILLVSQFTLYGDCQRGNRPSFTNAMPPKEAQGLYSAFVAGMQRLWPRTQSGIFAADMQISSINDGPVTIILESASSD